MKCYYCGNTDSKSIIKIGANYHYRCNKCGFEVDGTLVMYPTGDWEFDDWVGDIFEVE